VVLGLQSLQSFYGEGALGPDRGVLVLDDGAVEVYRYKHSFFRF
jgi:hypothetical protein